jgi:predicted ThiF/HesA family dinucleotide-utilizing enzyme
MAPHYGGTEEVLMIATQEVIRDLIKANPGADITEDRVRWVKRRGLVTPETFAGRLAWSRADVLALAQALDLVAPAVDERASDPVAAT